MKRLNLCLSVFVIIGAFACGVARAESQVPDPGAFGILVNPNADGTKLFGSVTLSYDYELDTPRALACDSQRWVKNIFAVASLQKNNEVRAFNSNYVSAGLSSLEACFDNQDNQVFFLKNFIEQVIIPQFFGCTPGACPGYAVKSIKNFLTTGVGAGYLEVVLAVK